MKTIIYILIFLTSTIGFAQDPNLTPFVGTWQWTEGNQTFTVELYIANETFPGSEGEVIKGNYEMTTNGSLGLTYKSNKLLLPDINYYYGPAIYGKSVDGIIFSGLINDNVLFNGDGNYSVKPGQLVFTIQNSCISCPITAIWKVSHLGGIRVGQPQTFTIPTNIVLTKIN